MMYSRKEKIYWKSHEELSCIEIVRGKSDLLNILHDGAGFLPEIVCGIYATELRKS